MNRSASFLLAVALVLAAHRCSFAGTVNFDDLSLSNGVQLIPSNYGSSGHVAVSYSTHFPVLGPGNVLGLVADPFMRFWTTGYGDLSKVAYASHADQWALVTLTAAPGYEVTLNSFDVAAFPPDRPDQTIRFLREDYSTISEVLSDGVIHGVGPTHDHYAPNITGDVIRIQFGPSWNTGIDNIVYSESLAATPVPLPAAAYMGMAMLGASAGWKRLRRYWTSSRSSVPT